MLQTIAPTSDTLHHNVRHDIQNIYRKLSNGTAKSDNNNSINIYQTKNTNIESFFGKYIHLYPHAHEMDSRIVFGERASGRLASG